MVRSNLWLPVVACLFVGLSQKAFAEFPALESKISPAVKVLADDFKGASVLVSIASDPRDHGWDLTSGIETELLASLRRHGVDAYDDDHDERMRFIATRKSFDYDKWQTNACHDFLLLAQYTKSGTAPRIAIVIYSADDATYQRKIEIKLESTNVLLASNTPQLNQSVLKFFKDRVGQVVGDGKTSAVAVGTALRELNCRSEGVFTFGRQLGPREAIVPGDILYFAYVDMREPGNAAPRRINRAFAVVSQIRTRVEVEVLYQRIHKGQTTGVIEREVFDLSAIVSGKLTVYRPVLAGDSDLPWTFGPLRKGIPEVNWGVKRKLDLLQVLNPELDAVHGPWAMKQGKLWFGYERQNKLQIPVYLPNQYSLKFTATRNFGKHGVTVIPVLAGKQVILTIDGFDGATSGIGLLDNKMERDNETTVRRRIFESGKAVDVEVQVRDNRLRFLANGEVIIDWTGNPKRLRLPKIHSVPSSDWLHIGGHESDFLISSMTLERLD